MRWLIAGLTVAALAAAVWALLNGGDRVIMAWALEGQRAAQTSIAGALRALRGGEPAALWGLVTVCGLYGVFHAVGPGHGKLLIGGYGLATQIGTGKLALVALVSSLAQAGTAIALVGAGLLLWGLGRAQMTEMAEAIFAPLSFGAIALVGLWLAWRGLLGWRRARADAAHTHGAGGAICGTCGHAHGPDLEHLARATSLRDLAAVVMAVAIRPCTGALFVLILTAQMGLFWAGVAGTLAMALGTAVVTVAAALAATTARRGLIGRLQDRPGVIEAQAALQIAVGLAVAVIATRITIGAL